MAAGPPAPEPKQTVPEHTRRKPVRKPLPEGTERVIIDIIQLEGEENFEHVGIEGRDVLERPPPATVIVELNYHKYVRKEEAQRADEGVVRAGSPQSSFRSSAGSQVPRRH